MALSDPTNVRLGLARKQDLLKRLAAQMAAKGPAGAAGRGGRAQGTGAQFASAVNLRAGSPARMTLPFDLPANRMRPAGYDPDQSGGNAWAAPQALAPVTPSGPPAGAGDAGASTSSMPTGADYPGATPLGGGYSTPGQGVVGTTPGDNGYVWTPAESGAYSAPSTTPAGTPSPYNSAYVSDGQGNWQLAPQDASAALNQSAPDPYTMMATAQLQRLMAGRNYAA